MSERIGANLSEGPIDPKPTGPSVHGVIRDLRIIGANVYAAGMRRQVYRRERDHQWVHIDRGVVQEPLLTTIAGFNSIDGIGEKELYAAGFGGEIWTRQNDVWKQINSPTNLILNKVLVVDKTVYICGQRGVLWSVGRKHVLWTDDGRKWTDVTP